jgi:hypothetical protein
MFDTYKRRLSQSKNLCQGHWDRAIDNYKHYLGRLDVGGMTETDYPYQSKMSVPISYEIVETVLPRIIGKDPEFTTVAVEPSDVPFEGTSKIVIESQYNNPKLEILGEPIYLKLIRGVKEELITGNVVYRAFWRRETRKRVSYLANLEKTGHKDEADIAKVLDLAKKAKADGEVFYSKKLIDAPFLDDFDIKHVPFFHFMPDPAFAEPGRMRYKIERDFMTFEELANEAAMFGYDPTIMADLKNLTDSGKGGFTPDISKDFYQKYFELFSSQLANNITTTDDDKIPMLIVDKMWMGDKVAVFVNEKYNLTGEEGMKNPYDILADPFIFGHDVVIPHSYFSFGEIDAIRKLEDGINDTLNMRFDNLLQSMLNYWLYNPKMIVNGDQFVPVPNSLTAVADVERAVRMISGKDVTPSAYKEADELMAIVQRVTGVNDYVKGNEGETLAGRTYGGLRLIQEAANARFIVKARTFEKVTLKALGYFALEMARQFITKDRISRMMGDTGDIEEKKIPASDLKQIKGFMDIRVIPNSAMAIDQQAEAIKLNSVADRFMTEKGPFANIPEEVYDKFLYKFLQAYGITDAIYWVREIRKARLGAKQPEKPVEPATPVLPGAPAIPPAGIPTMQSDQVSAQPNPLEMITNAMQFTPPASPQLP